jgi:hypothetical protein
MNVSDNFRLLHGGIVKILSFQFVEAEGVIHIVKILAVAVAICVPGCEIVIPKRIRESSTELRIRRMNP